MFELSIVRKYLVPSRKQLSVSLIALMSVTVITLVVWLVLVFLSVTEGIERSWLQKLTSLNPPIRIAPTPAYFSSYYYRIDEISFASNYTLKSIGEKLASSSADPYSPDEDIEIPMHWPSPNKKDLVKEAFFNVKNLKKEYPDIEASDYEISGALMRLNLIRPSEFDENISRQSFLTQVSYISSFNPQLISKLITEPKEFGELPKGPGNEIGVLLPSNFKKNGVLIGDKGYLSYGAQTSSSVQEQRLPIYVGGFYDPGVMAMGVKYILVPKGISHMINLSNSSFALDPSMTNGIGVWFSDLKKTGEIKKKLKAAFKEADIDKYWEITSFEEYDFAKDLLQQFQSDKYLFTLIGGIILIVACSNIISLLVLLVNDKKKEIGILRAMGASRKSVAMIFALCGMSMGLLSSLIGSLAAILTLKNIDSIAKFLSFLQGHEAFNAAFYGNSLPDQISFHALLFILIATPIIALTAGLVPALKACKFQPSEILRSE